MGNCPIKRTYKIINTQDALDPFILCRRNLLEVLQKLHKLQFEYRQSIDDCILKQDLFTALNLKLKQLKFKDFSNIIQSIITKLDNENSSVQGYVQREKFTKEVMEEVALQKTRIFFQSIDTLKNSKLSEEEFDSLNYDISKENQERQNLVNEELNFQVQRLKSLNRGANFERRKYTQSYQKNFS